MMIKQQIFKIDKFFLLIVDFLNIIHCLIKIIYLNMTKIILMFKLVRKFKELIRFKIFKNYLFLSPIYNKLLTIKIHNICCNDMCITV